MVDKRERFVQLAEKRVNRTIRDIRLIANLANRNNYAYTGEDAGKICAALEDELKKLRSRFVDDSHRQPPSFRL